MNGREKCRVHLSDVQYREGTDSLEPHQNHPPCPGGHDLVLTRSRCIQVSETHRLGSANGSAPWKKTNFVLPMLQVPAAGQRRPGRCDRGSGGYKRRITMSVRNIFKVNETHAYHAWLRSV